MKKLLYTLIASVIFITAWGQKKATQKDLQGTWKLATYTVSGVSLDIKSGKVTADSKGNNAVAAMQQTIIGDMSSYTEMLKDSYIEIQGNNLYRVTMDHVKNGPFTLTEEKGLQVMAAKFDDGTEDKIPFKIVDGNLYLASFSNAKEYIYVKK